MSKLTMGCKVFVINDNHTVRKGTLKGIYDSVGIAVVDFDDNEGTFEKVKLDKIGIVEETEAPTEKERPSAPVEKSEITITSEDFRATIAKIIAEESKTCHPAVAMTLTIGFVKLHKALFTEDPENE